MEPGVYAATRLGYHARMARPCLGLVALALLVACGGSHVTPTAPTVDAVPWVPEARARLGHVRDDALADFDAELARVRAIAQFEADGDDPDRPAVEHLIRMHLFDLARAQDADAAAIARAKSRARASADLLVDALDTHAGDGAFHAILFVVPELLVERPAPFVRYLRTSHTAVGSIGPPAYVGLFVDPITNALSVRADDRLDAHWSSLTAELRTWLRASGRAPVRDRLARDEASMLVDASYFDARAHMYHALHEGDVDDARALASVLVARDAEDVAARVVLLTADDVASGTLDGTPETLAHLATKVGTATLVTRFPRAVGPKLALLEALDTCGLREDYARIAADLSEDAMARLGPLRALHADGDDARVAHRDALARSTSPFLRAYALTLDGDPRHRCSDDATRYALHGDEAIVVALGAPLPLVDGAWTWNDAELTPALRDALVARFGALWVEARRRPQTACRGRYDTVRPCARPPDLDAPFDPSTLDDPTIAALWSTPFWDGALLARRLDALEGTPATMRVAYVDFRTNVLVRSRDARADARLATDGRILAWRTLLTLQAMRRSPGADATGDFNRLLPDPVLLLESSFRQGHLPGRSHGALDAPHTATELHELAWATRDREGNTRLEPVALEGAIPRFDGSARRALALFVALAALERGERARVDSARAHLPEDSFVSAALALRAADVFMDAPTPAPETAWIRSFVENDRPRPRRPGEAPTPSHPGGDDDEPVPAVDVSTLPPTIARLQPTAHLLRMPTDPAR